MNVSFNVDVDDTLNEYFQHIANNPETSYD